MVGSNELKTIKGQKLTRVVWEVKMGVDSTAHFTASHPFLFEVGNFQNKRESKNNLEAGATAG